MLNDKVGATPTLPTNNRGGNMSVIYCSFCDQLSDTDYAPDFDYDESTGEWKCESCNEDKDDLFFNEEQFENSYIED